MFYLQTYPSKLGLGAKLFQLTFDEERRTILFAKFIKLFHISPPTADWVLLVQGAKLIIGP